MSGKKVKENSKTCIKKQDNHSSFVDDENIYNSSIKDGVIDNDFANDPEFIDNKNIDDGFSLTDGHRALTVSKNGDLLCPSPSTDVMLIDNDSNALSSSNENEVLRQYIKHISKFPMLSVEEENRLLAEYIDNGNQKAGQAIVLSHMRLVVKIALQYRRYGINIMDIISEGNTGLMHALQKFDRSKNNRFSTYAVLWVRAFIQDFILKSWSLVKIGSSSLRKQLLFNLRGIKKVLHISSNADNEEKNKKLAQHFNISETEIGEITSSLNNRDISLETPVGDNENVSLGDTISRDSGDYDNILATEEEQKYRMKIFRESLSVLDERQREILVARYLEEKKATLDELSKRFNISKERVRQIEESAIKKLKQFAENYDK